MRRATLLAGLLALAFAAHGCADDRSAPDAGAPPSATTAASGTTSADPPSAIAPVAAPVSLTKASRRLACQGLRGELRLELYVSSGVSEEADRVVRELQGFLSAYANATFEHEGRVLPSQVKVAVIDVNSEQQRAEAKALGLSETAIKEPSSSAAGYLGFVLRYGNDKELIASWSPAYGTASLEYHLGTKMRRLRDRVDQIITRYGVVTDKEEIKLSANVSAEDKPLSIEQLVTEFHSQYKLEPLSLADGSRPIDPTLRGVIVTQPGRAYTDKELRRLDEFVLLGEKSIVFYVSAVNIDEGQPAMNAQLDLRGLDPLLRGYGVEMKKDVILVPDRALKLASRSAGGNVATVATPAVFAVDGTHLDATFQPFLQLRMLGIPFASTLVVHEDAQPRAKPRVVARAANASSESSSKLSVKYSASWKPSGPAEDRVVAVALDGIIRSAFDPASESKTPSRILVVSSSHFLDNPFVYAARKGAPARSAAPAAPPDAELMSVGRSYWQDSFRITTSSFDNTLAWMAADDDALELAATRSKRPAARKPSPPR